MREWRALPDTSASGGASAGGAVWYVKYRHQDGRQVQRLLGPAWTERGRPREGYFTAKTAQQELQALLVKAREGSLPGRAALRHPSHRLLPFGGMG